MELERNFPKTHWPIEAEKTKTKDRIRVEEEDEEAH